MYNKIILGHENYSISNTGVVTNNKTGRILKYDTTRGYKRVKLGKFGKKMAVHRLVAIAFIDNPHNKPQVNHIDGVKSNNHVDNLEWCTQEENRLHAQKNGLIKTRLYPIFRRQKISDDDASELCEAFSNGVSVIKIANFFNVTRATVYAILRKSKIERNKYVIQ